MEAQNGSPNKRQKTSIKKVCVIGASGFIGSHLCEHLMWKTEADIVAIDYEAAKIDHLTKDMDEATRKRITLDRFDIRSDKERLTKLIEPCDCVVNLAAICNPSEYTKRPLDTINSNFTDALPVTEICRDLGKHLIHFSTCEVYGKTLSHYMKGSPLEKKEENYILDEETTPMIMGPTQKQRWCYAAAKQLVERIIYAEGYENGLKFTIIRPYNWIGPRMDYVPGVDGEKDGLPRVLASFCTFLMKNEPIVLVNGGEAYRTFIYINDAMDALMRCIFNPEKSCGQIFNIGNPNNNVQIKELADIMINLYSEITGKPKGTTRDVDGEVYYGKGYDDSDLRIPSMVAIKRQLGWEPKTSLQDLLRTTMTYIVDTYGEAVDASLRGEEVKKLVYVKDAAARKADVLKATS